MDALNIINYVISIIFILCYSYQFFYILVPVFKKERPHRSEQGHDYAVLISARNEQAVIGNLLDSIARQTYERGSVTVFVVADNCTDDTARVSREHGGRRFREVRHLSGRQGLRPCLADGAYRRALPGQALRRLFRL